MKDAKLLVKYQACGQISPDDWKLFTNERLFDPSTTLAEVKEWVRKKEKLQEDFRLYEITLSEPEQ